MVQEDEDSHFTRRLGEIFNASLEIPPEQRTSYLDQACGSDQALRERVDALLKVESFRGGFMEDPTLDRDSELTTSLVGTSIGPYKVLEHIGEGGCGEVYLAEQRRPVIRKVALKVIKPGMDTKQVIARFESERQALAIMEHPNIARVIEAGSTAQGRPYFIMELVQGVPITHFCAESKFTTKERLQLFIQVCSAVQHAHQKGIIHRDLKPNNVLVTVSDDKPLPKIIDFGIAKATGYQLTDQTQFTQFRQVIGTPAYMSPEQAQLSHRDVDTRSDIYSLGVLLYELLTGTTPFDSETLQTRGQEAMLQIIREQEPTKPSTRFTETRKRGALIPSAGVPDSSIPAELDWVVLKALRKNRQHRYDTANAFAADLKRYLSHKPVTAVPPSRFYILQKWIHRHRAAAFAGTTIALAIATGMILVLLTYQRERKARAQSNRALFASEMKVAQNALEVGNHALARQILEQQIPIEGEPDHRGWWWRYLCGRLHPPQVSAHRFHGLDAVAVSPSGKVAASGYRGGVRPLELLSGDTLKAESLLGHLVHDARSMWFTDNGNLLIIEQGNLVTSITVRTKQEQWWQRPGAYPLRLTRNQQFLVGMFHDENSLQPRMTVTSFRRDEQAPIAESSNTYLLPSLEGMLRKFRLSPDSQWVSVCTEDGVRLLSIPRLEEQQALPKEGSIAAVAWSPDSRVLAVAYQYPYVVDLWEVALGERMYRLEGSWASSCFDLGFSPCGTMLALSDDNGRLHLWDLDTRKHRELRGSIEGREFAFFPDGKTLVAGDLGKLALWAVPEPPPTDLQRDAQSQLLRNLAYSSDGSLLAVSGADSVVRIYDPANGRRVKELGEPRTTRTVVAKQDFKLGFSQDGRRLFVANDDHTVTLYDPFSGAVIEHFTHPGSYLEDISLSPDGQWLGTAGNARMLIRDVATQKEALQTVFGPYRRDNLTDWHSADLLQFSPNKQQALVALGRSSWVNLLRTETWTPLAKASIRSIHSLSFSRDGTLLACAQSDQVTVREVPSLKVVDTIEGPRDAPNVSFSSDGSTLAIPQHSGRVQIYNRNVDAEVGQIVDAGEWIVAARFSPADDQLAVATLRHGILLFDAPSLSDIDAYWLERSQQELELAQLSANGRKAAGQEREARYANDPGAIKDWLWLGPIAFEGSVQTGLAKKFLANEATIRPRPDEQVSVNGKRYRWKALRRKDYYLDFRELLTLEEMKKPQAVYAVCYLQTSRPLTNLRLHTGSDDLARIYLNGERVYENDRGWIGRDLDVVSEISLHQGSNSLVFKIVNGQGVGNGSIRFLTASGTQVEGLRVTLNPPLQTANE